MSFAWPGMLAALVLVPVLAGAYLVRQRRRRAAAAAFHRPALAASVQPADPGRRRHVPPALLGLAVTALILAAAKPQRPSTAPVRGAGVMLVNDVSNSMGATDIRPSRLAAAQGAARGLLARVPARVATGQIAFARHPTLLQAPTQDRALARQAVSALALGGGGTAIGDSIRLAVQQLRGLRLQGHKVPGAILVISDGVSNVGVSPLTAAAEAKAAHLAVDTIAIGTPSGQIPDVQHGTRTVAQVPVDPRQLAAIARTAGGHAYTAASGAQAAEIYAHLARQIGTRRVTQNLASAVAGGGALLLLAGAATSLLWFGRLA